MITEYEAVKKTLMNVFISLSDMINKEKVSKEKLDTVQGIITMLDNVKFDLEKLGEKINEN